MVRKIDVQGWADKLRQLFHRGSGEDISRERKGNDMRVSGYMYGTLNNMLTLNMDTFFRFLWFNSTAELRPQRDLLRPHLTYEMST